MKVIQNILTFLACLNVIVVQLQPNASLNILFVVWLETFNQLVQLDILEFPDFLLSALCFPKSKVRSKTICNWPLTISGYYN